MLFRILALSGFATHAVLAHTLLLCGADEVFQMDPAVKPAVKTWSWRARDCPQIPANLKNAFATTDECKPTADGKQILITSSSGGCALVEFPSGKAVWWARVPNAHSIESLPGGKIVVASSVGAEGNKLVFFDTTAVGPPLAEIPLHSAHGLVWDSKRECLWALGFSQLIACSIPASSDGGFAPKISATHPIPDKDGHDLRPVAGSADLVFSTEKGVWRFNRELETFRPDPNLTGRAQVKSVDRADPGGQMVVMQASDEHWWTDSIHFLLPEGALRIEGERLYKARWMGASQP